MANTVTFPNGNSYDGDSGTGHMGNGSHRSHFLLIGDTINLADTYMGYVDDAEAAKPTLKQPKPAPKRRGRAESARDAAAASADAAAEFDGNTALKQGGHTIHIPAQAMTHPSTRASPEPRSFAARPSTI